MGDMPAQDYYYSKLVKMYPDYWKKEYARFLFENNLKIDSAIILTHEYNSSNEKINSMWGQFFIAHSLAYTGKLEQAVQGYSNWMKQNENIWLTGDSYWPLYLYASFANVHNADLERALNYIRIAEENRNMLIEKLLLAEILFKLGDFEKSIEKLNESLGYTESQIEYDKIIRLIEKYKSS